MTGENHGGLTVVKVRQDGRHKNRNTLPVRPGPGLQVHAKHLVCRGSA